MNEIVQFVAGNPEAALGILGGALALLLLLVLYLLSAVSSLKSRYNTMMVGAE